MKPAAFADLEDPVFDGPPKNLCVKLKPTTKPYKTQKQSGMDPTPATDAGTPSSNKPPNKEVAN